MKARTLLSILLFVGISSVYAQESVNETDGKGRKQGVWVKKYENDQERYRGTFKNDKPIGTFFYYYEDGNKSSEVSYIGEDGVEAMAKFFHRNGTVMGEGKYVNKKKVGVWKYYDDQTTLASIEPYKDGVIHGMVKVYYLNGQVAAEIPYIDGLKSGDFVEYFSNGAIKIQGRYQDNTYDGPYVQFFSDGKKMIEGQYKAAVKDGLWKYFNDDGRLKAQQVYANGKMIKEKFEPGFEPEELPIDVDDKDKIDEKELLDEYYKSTEESK